MEHPPPLCIRAHEIRGSVLPTVCTSAAGHCSRDVQWRSTKADSPRPARSSLRNFRPTLWHAEHALETVLLTVPCASASGRLSFGRVRLLTRQVGCRRGTTEALQSSLAWHDSYQGLNTRCRRIRRKWLRHLPDPISSTHTTSTGSRRSGYTSPPCIIILKPEPFTLRPTTPQLFPTDLTACGVLDWLEIISVLDLLPWMAGYPNNWRASAA